MATKVTVECPLCGEVLEVTEYDRVSRTDMLLAHIVTKHLSQVRPAAPQEGPPLPRGWGIKWPWGEDVAEKLAKRITKGLKKRGEV